MDHFKYFVASALVGFASVAQAATLDVTLKTNTSHFNANSNVKVQLSVTNTSDHQVKILKWYLAPQSKLQGNIFSVQVDGSQATYTGPTVKRGAPTDKDYITLGAGQSINQTLDLSSFYDMTQAGTYSVHYNVTAMSLLKSAATAKSSVVKPQTLNSNQVSFWVQGVQTDNLLLKQSKTVLAKTSSSISYLGSCSNSEKSSIVKAVQAAQSLSSESYNYLVDNSDDGADSVRYDTWFGTYSYSRYSTVTSHFYKINNALHNEELTLDCSCESDFQSAFAYVYPNQPYHIHLCDAFWSANTTGTDSKSGTLIHELSHFTVNGGTDDIAYGQYYARQLAQSSPSKAIQNADSHEYFAENNPSLQ